MIKFAHNNFNVLNLEASLKFYKEALGLQEVRRLEKPDFTLVYLGDGGETPHQLELTWLKDRKAVSYTHLDVYKRQIRRPEKSGQFLKRGGGKPWLQCLSACDTNHSASGHAFVAGRFAVSLYAGIL